MSKPPTLQECQKVFNAISQCGGKRAAARALGLAPSSLYDLIDRGERLYGLKLEPTATPESKGNKILDVINGKIIAGSDAHYWPGGEPCTAHRAFVYFAKKFRKELVAVVKNGDALDFPRISRHPPLGWTRMPEPKDEIEVAQERLGEIAKAAGKVPKFWPAGNHDQRWEQYLSTHAAEAAGVFGTRLVDHFPDWEPCWSVLVNNRVGGLIIKHRGNAGGVHATYNNTVKSGRSIATGHLHSQKCTPYTDFNGTRYGIDMGCMADPWGPQFQYLEGNTRDWRAGIVVFSFSEGVLMPPEFVTVIEPGVVAFRGELIEV